jgi:hypothetical protein
MLISVAHLEIEVLKQLMLTGVELTEKEENHLFHCSECQEAMAKATIRYLEKEQLD